MGYRVGIVAMTLFDMVAMPFLFLASEKQRSGSAVKKDRHRLRLVKTSAKVPPKEANFSFVVVDTIHFHF
jgi:hypothetical protein